MKYLLPIALVSGAVLLLKRKKTDDDGSTTVEANSDTQVTATQKEKRKITFFKS